MTPSIPKLIEVERAGGSVSVRVDGEELPWHTKGGAGVEVTKDGVPAVTLTIPAEHVEVTDRLVP